MVTEERKNGRTDERSVKCTSWAAVAAKKNKCNICDCIGKSEAGLKTNKTKKHKESI